MKPGPHLDALALPAGTCVIADLHLDPLQAGPWNAFGRWLEGLTDLPALVILGDLFEYWFGGSQARDPAYAPLLDALRARARSGTQLHFLHGNRDFLLGREFEQAVEGRVHPDGLLGRLPGGMTVLLLHGDELATRDRSYQRLRTILRSGAVRALAGVAPARFSSAVARSLRRRSKDAVRGKSEAYLELQAAAAAEWCTGTGAEFLVCGHAHRFRREALEGGGEWTVLDAFGGDHDLMRVGAGGELSFEASRGAGLQAGGTPLSSRAPMIIALDGPAGAGKSTIARLVARELGFFFLDTGAMYRALTLAVLERELAPEDGAACAGVARELKIEFDADGRVLLDGRPGEPAIRGEGVTRHVSQVSAHAAVREIVVALQRAVARRHRGTVAEGRDTTTVVFPEATYKFYLDASPRERALRRARQENALERLDEIQVDIERRDASDSTREHAPLLAAHDALRIDTDGLSVDEVVARILARVRESAP